MQGIGQAIIQGPQVGISDVRKAQREGTIEAIREMIKEKTKNRQRLNAMFSKSDRKPLFHLSTFFPLKFFPVKIVIDSSTISITFNDFMSSGQIVTLTIDIIQEVTAECGPLFATLIIETNKPLEPVITVRHLKKDDALKAKRIIQGLITAKKNKVDVEDIPDNELVQKLEDLGETKEAEISVG